MMKNIKVLILTLSVMLPLAMLAQEARIMKQHDMKKWGIPAGNYSGISWLGGNRFALVSDKQKSNGWHEVTIDFKPSGDIREMGYVTFHRDTAAQGRPRDAEGIVVTNDGTLFISAEGDQRIVEHGIDGSSTGRELAVPAQFGTDRIFGNRGFEALAYGNGDGCFWTTTEQGLKMDMDKTVKYPDFKATGVRLQRFSPSLQPLGQYAYLTDEPQATRNSKFYAFGVPEMTVLNDSVLLVMERELFVSSNYNNSFCVVKIYMVDTRHMRSADPSVPLKGLAADAFTEKKLLTQFRTVIKMLGKKNYANYEGMCLGPVLPDGSLTLLLVADSQDRSGNWLYHLKDYIRVIKISY